MRITRSVSRSIPATRWPVRGLYPPPLWVAPTPLRTRELRVGLGALDPKARGQAVWQFAIGALQESAIWGTASSSEMPEELLRVAGGTQLAEPATAPLSLRHG
mmetsp:Transcript_26665/g.80845  ORF Transcript_26665/g.80845 Transcript_26665/m.80845 type:complete len:103 (-) Transcript_26665:213-521(-)